MRLHSGALGWGWDLKEGALKSVLSHFLHLKAAMCKVARWVLTRT